MNLEQTLEFIKKAHAGQYRKSGEPYWEHPVSVMNRLGPEANLEIKQIALLHDVVEDTKYTYEDLLNLGFSKNVVLGVKLLTKEANCKLSYLDKIKELAEYGFRPAILVKIADNEDNSDLANINRIKNLEDRQKHLEMANSRYKKSLEILRKALYDCS